ncbi:MAG: sigma-70 family RNA polymerase sigma factor [Streptosporangiales bacterium]|nr:sigma-70 family RNA polymerase sigma factor [Streptosporangiales bacterium]
MTQEGAAMSGSDDFAGLTEPFRRELLVYCYRMLGSVHEAEDLVQETLLRAWRSYARFDPCRASLRTWLYRIATHTCLTALEHRGRRPLPSGLVGPSDNAEVALDRRAEVAWLQPIPDALFAAVPGDPATIVGSRNSIRLAFIAALQHLPARQRAVLILRDVLAWRAGEVASLLDTTTTAVNSALQRARTQLAQVAPVEDEVAEPTDADQRELLERYVAAFVNADMTALMRLLREDVVVEMPPILTWFAGRETVGRFLAPRISPVHDAWRMLPTGANAQPAAASYLRGDNSVHSAHSLQVFTMTGASIARITAFQDPGLFATFGQPLTLPSSGAAASIPRQ